MPCGRQAYGIFLTHYVFVIWLQYAVYDYSWPAFAKFAVVFTGTLGLSWAVVNGRCYREFRLWRG